MHQLVKQAAAAVVAAALLAMPVSVERGVAEEAGCQIPHSACYPWRIPADRKQSTILNVVPNNAITAATYRVCLCPPEKAVEVVFSFSESEVVIGRVAVGGDGPVCRDYRIETSRRSRVVLRRPPESEGKLITGCYVTAPAGQ